MLRKTRKAGLGAQLSCKGAFLMTHTLKNLPAVQDSWVCETDHALITSISCTDHMTAHALITWLIMH